jgi:hypothetical protein
VWRRALLHLEVAREALDLRWEIGEGDRHAPTVTAPVPRREKCASRLLRNARRERNPP